MLRVVLGLAAIALLASLSLDESASARGSESGVAQLFRDRCAKRHAVPAPTVRTDRAWLDQIKRTA